MNRELRSSLAWLLGIWILNAAVLAWHIFSHDALHSVDGMYHIRVARLYWEQGIQLQFPWMQFSIAQKLWADHHFFYHVLLIPFSFGDLTFGLKLSAVFYGSLALSACSAYLLAHKVRFVPVYAAFLLLASDIFLFRISMPRSISISLIFLMLALWALEKKRYLLLLGVSFLYIWTYHMALVLLPMAACAACWHRLVEGCWDGRPLLYVTGGLLLGLALNPFVPDSFGFFFFHFAPAFPGQELHSVVKIPEWEAIALSKLLLRNAPAWALGFLLPLGALVFWRKWPRDIGVVLVGAVVLFAASLKANRLLEYGVPFAVVFGARVLDTALFRAEASKRWRRAFVAGAVACGLLACAMGARYHRDFSNHAFDIHPHLFRGAARWLEAHTRPGEVVFHTDWASFSYLFFHNTHNYYISGLSPLFFYAWKPKLYRAYLQICGGKTRDPARWIKQLFRSRYVALSSRRGNALLVRQLSRDGKAKVVYQDRRVRVYRLGD